MRNSQRVKFSNANGHTLAGILELPATQTPRAFCVFSHCFTCTKDLKAIVRISRRLAEHGWGVLRYDFTGLGESTGDFSHTTFHDNVSDLVAAADFLAENHQAPQYLIGHSLGGAASIVAAPKIPSVSAVVNIASPANTQHLAGFLSGENPDIEAVGAGTVVIGGRPHLIRQPMIQTLRNHDHPKHLRDLSLPLLVMFSPEDETLPFEQGLEMFRLACGPVSFVTIDGADHLLVNQAADVRFVADLISVWAGRFIGDSK
jgi:putative redox protein